MPILCRVTRGDLTESIHVIFATVVDDSGNIVFSTGDPNYVTCIRSSLKPFQAAAAIRSGAIDAAGFDESEIALMCASHLGENIHVKTAQKMLSKIGYTSDDYDCGIHPPADMVSRHELIRSGIQPNPLHNNCSGKHAGMLAIAKHLANSPKDYTNPDNIVQKTIYGALQDYSGVNDIPMEIDGCSAPTAFFTLETIAKLYQKLSTEDYPELVRVFNAMSSFPYNVAGKDHFDTKFISALDGNAITKGGGESVRGIALKNRDGKNLGISLKVLDGSPRAMPVGTITLLEHLDLLTKRELSKLKEFRKRERKNCRNNNIGQVEVYIES
ncbi:MAG: asparaginase [Candidatus Neomarinimicrobiota bacterium]